MNIVFVYGSLKRGLFNHFYLQDSEYLGEYITEPKYTMYDYGDYPAVAVHGNTAIVGELFRVSQEVMRNLDELEEYPFFYDRIQLATPQGQAWMYVVNNAQDNPVVAGGVWLSQRLAGIST